MSIKKIYYLHTCSTCQRILNELGDISDFALIDIKRQNISDKDLDFLKKKIGSYEALFSKRAMKYKEWGLKEKQLTDEDFKNYILEEYTFLKRPVIMIGEDVFVGNAKKTIEAVKEKIHAN